MTVSEIVVLPDPEALAREAARRFVKLADEAIASRDRFSVALSGGSTPGVLYQLLAREPHRSQIAWAQVHLFWGDERCVPPGNVRPDEWPPSSNYHLAHETLIAHVPIPPENIHRIQGELEPENAAREYENGLKAFFARIPNPKSFDLVLLGLGSDGHTASLFPGSEALDETERLAVAVSADYEGRPAERVTLTLPAINAARQAWFLVSGATKAEIVRAVLEKPGERLPAQQVDPTSGRLTWLLDAAAANLLRGRR